MIYNGKEASKQMQGSLTSRIATLGRPPILAIISATSHPSIHSFIAIKRAYAQAIGVTIKEYKLEEETDESEIIKFIKELSAKNECDGIIVQLPLPSTHDTQAVLDSIPEHLDVDVLTTKAYATFTTTGSPLPTVVSAVAHILNDTNTSVADKKVVVVGQGRLVGAPVSVWAKQQGAQVVTIEKDTDPVLRAQALQQADIIISGSGSPHSITPRDISSHVALIDAGTSEESGVLSGDCDPRCASHAHVFTPVPGGVGPLTVAYLFDNLISFAEKKQ